MKRQLKSDPCFPNPCQNGNECLFGLCICEDGFGGEFCETGSLTTTVTTTTSGTLSQSLATPTSATTTTVRTQNQLSTTQEQGTINGSCISPDPNDLAIINGTSLEVFCESGILNGPTSIGESNFKVIRNNEQKYVPKTGGALVMVLWHFPRANEDQPTQVITKNWE